jgi:hypothetical protein
VSNLAQSPGGVIWHSKNCPKGEFIMTAHQQHLAEQVSKETDSGKLKHLIAELCLEFDSEREENRQLRPGCWDDCREHQQMTA